MPSTSLREEAPERRVAHSRERLLTSAAVAIALTVFVASAIVYPTRPGLYEDEMGFMQAAVEGRAYRSLFGVPMLIGTYVGAVKAWIYWPIFQIVDGAQVVGAGMLRGLHDTRVPMVFTFIGYWAIGIGVGAWLAFKQNWEGQGLWTGLAVGLAIVAVLMIWRWTRREKLGLTRVAH